MPAPLCSNWAVEVPLIRLDPATGPQRGVPCGDAVFQFGTLPLEGAVAGKSEPIQGSSSSRCLVWQLEGAAQLLLREVSVSEERREGGARLAFTAPLLPSVSCTESQAGTRVSVVSADGTLHTVLHTWQASSVGLARHLQAPGAVTSTQLMAHFQRAGAPTCLLEVGGVVCIGTAEGNIVCLPAGETDPAAAFQLSPTSGFTKMLGGLFGRATAGQGVRLLQELRFMEHRLLCAVHEDCSLRLWDLPTRRLVHDAQLLPSNVASGWLPTLARLTAEPLDASTSILVVHFQQRQQEGAGGQEGGDQEAGSQLIMFEIFLEHRGEGAYKVLLEMGPRLPSHHIRHLYDLALENVALHSIGAWLLYGDEGGRRHLSCVPLTFKGGPAQGGTDVQLVEGQLLEGCTPVSLQLQQQMWQALEGRLPPRALPPTALGAAFAGAVLAPGRLSRPALHTALAQLGCSTSAEEVLNSDLSDLEQQLPRWVAATSASVGGNAAAAAGAAGASAALLAKWSGFLQAYASAWQEQHLPLTLLQLPSQGDVQSLIVARQGGLFTTLRPAVAPEEVLLLDSLPVEWQQVSGAEVQQASAALQAAAAVFQAAGGGQLPRLLWACLKEGQDLRSTVLPALVSSLAAGSLSPPPPSAAPGTGRLGFASAGGVAAASGAAAVYASWRAACRRLPLQLARLGEQSPGGFAAAISVALNVLASGYQDTSRLRSKLPALTQPIRIAALSTLTQVAWSQVQVLLQLVSLLQYLLWSQSLATYTVSPEEAQQLETQLLPRTLELLHAAAVAYWTSVTPVTEAGRGVGAGGSGADGSASLDPAQMVVSLRISGDSPSTAAAAPKRARLSQGRGSYVASLLLTTFASSSHAHVVRDIPDLHRVALLFTQRLQCLGPLAGPAASAARRHQPLASPPAAGQVLSPTDAAVEVNAALFRGKHTAQLAALQCLMPAGSQDMRLLFFKACSAARQIGLAPSPEERQRLEEESCSLFFRVATVFSQTGGRHAEQAAAVASCVSIMLEDKLQAAEAAGSDASGSGSGSLGTQVTELQYYEELMTMFERQGCYAAQARCALAAARQVAASLQASMPAAGGQQQDKPAPEHVQKAQQAQSRLWHNVFTCMLECRRWEEAYVALLSIEVAETQIGCLHTLIQELCKAPGGVALLCRLPFAHNLLVVRAGRQVWAPMLEEVVATLQRQAINLNLRASPQPYKVLADFHIARGNYQAAAGAMLAFARRLVQECPDDPPMLQQAEHALAAAVSCLSLVERQQAWVEDPAPPGAADPDQPVVLTLAALQREYAIVRGHATLAAAMPGSNQSHASLTTAAAAPSSDALQSGDGEKVFAQLLALGLHNAAFQLAEAVFVGTQLTRAYERAFASLAASCVKQQIALGSASTPAAAAAAAMPAAAGGDDDMETEDAAGPVDGAEAAGSAAGALSSRHGSSEESSGPVADWRRLKDWLHRHEAGTHRFRLRLVILESILRTEPAFMLPPWLMATFKPGAGQHGQGDLAGALRVLMKHGRLEDAALLATQHLQHLLHSVPSVSMKSMAQVYFPQELLDQLLAQLGRKGLVPEQQQVSQLLQSVRDSSLRQTQAIEQLYAH